MSKTHTATAACVHTALQPGLCLTASERHGAINVAFGHDISAIVSNKDMLCLALSHWIRSVSSQSNSIRVECSKIHVDLLNISLSTWQWDLQHNAQLDIEEGYTAH